MGAKSIAETILKILEPIKRGLAKSSEPSLLYRYGKSQMPIGETAKSVLEHESKTLFGDRGDIVHEILRPDLLNTPSENLFWGFNSKSALDNYFGTSIRPSKYQDLVTTPSAGYIPIAKDYRGGILYGNIPEEEITNSQLLKLLLGSGIFGSYSGDTEK